MDAACKARDDPRHRTHANHRDDDRDGAGDACPLAVQRRSDNRGDEERGSKDGSNKPNRLRDHIDEGEIALTELLPSACLRSHGLSPWNHSLPSKWCPVTDRARIFAVRSDKSFRGTAVWVPFRHVIGYNIQMTDAPKVIPSGLAPVRCLPETAMRNPLTTPPTEDHH